MLISLVLFLLGIDPQLLNAIMWFLLVFIRAQFTSKFLLTWRQIRSFLLSIVVLQFAVQFYLFGVIVALIVLVLATKSKHLNSMEKILSNSFYCLEVVRIILCSILPERLFLERFLSARFVQLVKFWVACCSNKIVAFLTNICRFCFMRLPLLLIVVFYRISTSRTLLLNR